MKRAYLYSNGHLAWDRPSFIYENPVAVIRVRPCHWSVGGRMGLPWFYPMPVYGLSDSEASMRGFHKSRRTCDAYCTMHNRNVV